MSAYDPKRTCAAAQDRLQSIDGRMKHTVLPMIREAAMQQIADWLKQLGMQEYIQRFAENDIDFAILGDLTDQDLKEIGVASIGHRRKLLRAIADLKGVQKDAPT